MKTTLFVLVGAFLIVAGLLYIQNMTAKPALTTTQTEAYSTDETGTTQNNDVQGTTEEKKPEGGEKQMEKPAMQINSEKKYVAKITTSVGSFSVELNAKATPITVNNFVTLAKKKFYDNTVFHRVIKGFMIQGGDPTGTGSGGPGYKFDDEKFDGEYTRGTMAMANAGPNTNGSQFFVMHEDNPLPKNYVIFGKVIEGIETIDRIATAPVTASGMGENSKPVTPVVIKSVEIVE